MRKQRVYTILIFSFILIPWAGYGQAVPEKSLVTDADMIRRARLRQNDAMATGNIEVAASFWTEDVTLRRGLGSSITGKEAYRALLDPSPNQDSLIYIREPDLIDISPHWPLGFESGTWEARQGLDGPIVITGRYSAQWVKRDGNWLIRSEIFVALTCRDLTSNWPALP